MAVLPILTAPDRRLRAIARPVEHVDGAVRQLMDDMLETMYRAPGIGLAAPQVGVSLRVIVVDLSYDREERRAGEPIYLANPVIVQSGGEIVWEEGCLSVPDTVNEVNRAAFVEVVGLGRDGEEVRIEATGLLAVCLQHEMDHLNGVLFIDHLSRLKRELILKRLQKRKQANGC
jgi:peptide deformylase